MAGLCRQAPARCHVIDGGPACHTAGKWSNLDYFIVSPELRRILQPVGSLDMELARHRPVALNFCHRAGKQNVDMLVRPKKNQATRVGGPQL